MEQQLGNFRNYLIDVNKFQVVKNIKNGSYGSVYLIKDKKTKFNYAAKIITDNSLECEQTKKIVNREIGIMIRFQHETIIRFYGYSLTDFEGQNRVTIIMDYAQNGSLASFLKLVKLGQAEFDYDNTARQIILIGISRGMMYLHQNRVIHRDLKPDNVLLDGQYRPHITDFGLSKIFYYDQSLNQSQGYGTSIYMAPEVINGDKYDRKADVYSFGILMFEIVTDSVPYPSLKRNEMSLYQFNNKVINENYRPEFTVDVKESIKNLIIQCWSKDPNDRPSFEEIFNKLAFNIEDCVNDIFSGDENNKFYLDGVDSEKVLSYAFEITEGENKINQIIGELKIDNEMLKNEKSNIKSKLKNHEKLIGYLLKKNEKLKKDNDQLIIEKNEIENELKRHEALITNFSNDNEQLKKDNEQLKLEKNEIENELKRHEKLIDDFSSDNEQLKKDKIEIEKKMQHDEELINKLVKDNEEIKNQLQNILLELNKSKKEVKSPPLIKVATTKSADVIKIDEPLNINNKTTNNSPIMIKDEPINKTKKDTQINKKNQKELIHKVNVNRKSELVSPIKSVLFHKEPSLLPKPLINKKPILFNDTDEPILSFSQKEDKEFSGIIDFLTMKSGNNIHDNEIIEVTSNSIYNPFCHPKNLLDHNQNNYYEANVGEKDVVIVFDFKKIEIEISKYSIKSAAWIPNHGQIKNWIIEISNDLNEWTKIDEQLNSSELNGLSILKTFDVEQKKFCRFVRFHHIGDFWGMNCWSLRFSCIEFYGRLKKPI